MGDSRCSRCARAATQRCDHCADLLCEAHIESGLVIARNVFGPRLFSRDATVCDECYRERFWLAARGAIGLVAVAIVAITLIDGAWLGAALALGVFAVWFVSAGYLARRAVQDRERARQPQPDVRGDSQDPS